MKNGKGDTNTDFTDILKNIKEIPWASLLQKFDNLNEMGQFFERHRYELPRIMQGKIHNLSNAIFIKYIEFLIKNPPR